MKIIIDEEYYGFSLEGDNTGNMIESMAIKEGFRKQDDRHITILSGSTEDSLKNILDESQEKENILEEIKTLLESFEWKWTPAEIYKIQKQDYFGDPNIKEDRESYINLVDMPDMKIFYEKLNSLLKSNLPTQLPHITLFTKGEREKAKWSGIPIPSIEEFNNLNPRKIN